jgi:small subunit ribosomal protein S27Ae
MSKKVEKKDEKAAAAAKAAAPAKTEESKKEEVKPQKATAAPKPEKKAKKEEKGIYSIYKIEGDKVARLRPTCERCGPGYFMADHHDRFTCGHCGFTRYKHT